MIADFVLIMLLVMVLQKIGKVVDSGKAFLQAGLIYAIVVLALKLSGAQGNDLAALIKSVETYHDAEVKKLFE